jgi:heavy metal translocating P-type ATPase
MIATSVTNDLTPTVAAVEPTIQIENIHYQVVHWTEGRFRIRIPRLADDPEYVGKLHYLVDGLDFVSDVQLNPASRSLTVEYDYEASAKAIAIVQEKLFSAIQTAPQVEVPIGWTPKTEEEKASNEVDFVERLAFPAAGLALSVGAMIGLPIPGFVIAGVVFVGAIPVFKRAWEAIQQDRQLTIDFLDGLALSLHTLQGHYFAPSFMLGLVEGGEAIRDLTARGSERANLDLLDCLSKTAFVIRDGQVVEIPTAEVVVGDRIIVYPGDQIPVDGSIISGTGIIDQCKLTGESVPVTRREGEEVFASTLLVDGTLTIDAERVGNNTRAGVIVNLMQAAPVHDTRVENYAAMVANQAVLPTLAIGAGVGLMSGDLNRAVALLTLDFGTGIRVSVPTTILSVLTYTARNGVLIRSGRAIEILARIDTVVFDKTGTLTVGHAGVNDIDIMDDRFTKDDVLCLAATAEQGLTHPIAEAIVHNAKDKGIALKECEEWEYKVGLGAAAKIDGMQIIVGSPRFMNQENVSLDEYDRRYPDAKSGGQSLVYIAGDGKLIGVVRYSDPAREESREVIAELKRMGITAYMLSGDVSRVAKAVAGNLGMNPDNIYAEAFPERKVEVVKSLHDSGKTVAFCGDGINDSAALAYADVSISFAGATDIARETADVVLMEDDLRGLLMAIKAARQAMDIIWQNTAIVAVPNLGALVSGIFFALDPLLAVVINNGTAILAELNGLRPLMGPGMEIPALTGAKAVPQEAIAAPSETSTPVVSATPIVESKPQPAQEDIATSIVESKPQLAEEVSVAIAPETNGNGHYTNGNGNGHYTNGNGNGNGKHPAVETAIELEMSKKPSPLGHLKQSDLARRLGMSPQTLTYRRSRTDFVEWSMTKDPEGVAWLYEPGSRYFYTVEFDDSNVQQEQLATAGVR